ncbi:CinA family protein, partial [Chloroflexota bacterium]
REAIAETLGEKAEVDPELERELREFFARRRVANMSLSNIRQATLIPSARAIRNIQGTAPGWWVEKDNHIIIAMPGPPRELHPIWQQEVLPRLRKIAAGELIASRTIKTHGLGEAEVGERVTPLFASANPTLGIYAKADGVHLRLTAKAENGQLVKGMLDDGEARLRSILGQRIWGTDDDTLEAVVGRMLMEKGLSLAVMEDNTGGLLAATIAEDPAAEGYFKGGLIAYTKEAQIACGLDAELVTKQGSSGAEVAQTMASLARSQLGASMGIGITVVDETIEIQRRPMKVIYIGMDDGTTGRTIANYFTGNIVQVKRRAVTAALSGLREMLAS